MAVAHLEGKCKSLVLVTQNVDDLHEKRGSSAIIHMHGSLRSLRCQNTGLSEVRMGDHDLAEEFRLLQLLYGGYHDEARHSLVR